MKKLIYSLIVIVVALSVKTTNLQAQSFKVGTNVINLGVGFGYTLGYYGSYSATPVISGSFEHGIAELGPGVVGIGGIISYQGASYTDNDPYYGYKDKWSTTFIAVRGTWHPDFLNGDKYDVYGALQLGYIHYGFTETFTGSHAGYLNQFAASGSLNSGLFFGIVVGGRYYFTDNIGAFAELGYDLSFFKIGLAIKFGGSK